MSQFSAKINQDLVRSFNAKQREIIDSFLRGEKADVSRLFNDISGTPEFLGICLAFYQKIELEHISCPADTLKDITNKDTQQFIKKSGAYFFDNVFSLLVSTDGTPIAKAILGEERWDEIDTDKRDKLTCQFLCAMSLLLSMELFQYSADYADHAQAMSALGFVILSFINVVEKQGKYYSTLKDVKNAFDNYIEDKLPQHYQFRFSEDASFDNYQWVAEREPGDHEIEGDFVWVKPNRDIVLLDFNNDQNPYCLLLQHLCGGKVPEDSGAYYTVLEIVSEARKTRQSLIECFRTVFEASNLLAYDYGFVLLLIDAVNSAAIKNDKKNKLTVYIIRGTFVRLTIKERVIFSNNIITSYFSEHNSTLADLTQAEFLALKSDDSILQEDEKEESPSNSPSPSSPAQVIESNEDAERLRLEEARRRDEEAAKAQVHEHKHDEEYLPEEDSTEKSEEDQPPPVEKVSLVEKEPLLPNNEVSPDISADHKGTNWTKVALIAASGAFMVAVGVFMFITTGVGIEVTGVGIAYINSALIIGGCLQIGAGGLLIAKMYARTSAWCDANPKFHTAAKVLTALALIGIGIAIMVTTWGVGSAISVGLISVATEILGGVLGAGLITSGLTLIGSAFWHEARNILPACCQSDESEVVNLPFAPQP